MTPTSIGPAAALIRYGGRSSIGERLTHEAYDLLVDIISGDAPDAGKARRHCAAPLGRSVWVVIAEGHVFPVIYDDTHRCIVTVLPPRPYQLTESYKTKMDLKEREE